MRFAWVVIIVSALLTGSEAFASDTSQRKVDRIFAAYDRPGSPGCAVGVIRDGSFAYRKGYGMGSLELGVPLSFSVRFLYGLGIEAIHRGQCDAGGGTRIAFS